MIRLFLVGLFFTFLIASCKKDPQKTQQLVTFDNPAKVGSQQPFLFSDGTNVQMSWTQRKNDSVHSLYFSELENEEWIDPIEITEGDDWFVNWADFPAIAKNNENLLVHYLQKSDSATYAYDVHLILSSTNGNTWNKDILLHKDSTNTEHGFVTLLPYKDDFLVTWLDGRNTDGSGGHGEGHESQGAMNIRAARITASGSVMDAALIDSKTCDCCQTSAAITEEGPIVVYRDRTDQEVRDIAISRWVDGAWTNPQAIYNDEWKINGCPVNGPKTAAYKNTVAVAWFTAADNVPKVKLAFSKDNGANFDLPIDIVQERAIGRVDLTLLDRETALVSWMESTKKAAVLKMMKIANNGEKGRPIVITTLDASRKTGFPQFELVGDKIILAWNHVEEAEFKIKTASLPLSTFN